MRAVAIVSPVTDPLALSEFSGVSHVAAMSIDAMSLVESLAGRPVGYHHGQRRCARQHRQLRRLRGRW